MVQKDTNIKENLPENIQIGYKAFTGKEKYTYQKRRIQQKQ